MRVLKAALTVIACAGLTVVGTSAATASPAYSPPTVSWVSPVVHALSHSGSAVVHTRYTCSGGDVGTHLFIGVKQGPDVNATNHTSSEFAKTFYSTNWNSDGPGLSLHCDGVTHNVKFVVKPDPYWAHADSAPPLTSGQAFIQVCVFDSTNTGEGDPNGFAFNYSMKKVVLNG